MTFDPEKLRALHEAATPGNLATAQRHIVCETVECPACNGDGELDAADYCNFDGVALGVQFYGIGSQFGAHEALWRYFIEHRAAILSLSERNAALEAQVQAFTRLLPSMAGSDAYPDSKVVAVYANLGELRAIRALQQKDQNDEHHH